MNVAQIRCSNEQDDLDQIYGGQHGSNNSITSPRLMGNYRMTALSNYFKYHRGSIDFKVTLMTFVQKIRIHLFRYVIISRTPHLI